MGISKKLIEEVKATYGTKISEKHDNICVHASEFVKKHFADEAHQIIISGSQITDVVLNYFVDIHRFKERRGMDDDNSYVSNGKIAAFTAKWIVRLRPICVEPLSETSASPEEKVFAKYVNEIFAIEHAELILNTSLSAKLYRELAFEFRQKKLSETQLYMTLEQASGFYACT